MKVHIEKVNQTQGGHFMRSAVDHSFTSREVLIVGVNAPGTALFHRDNHLGYEQSCDGPTFIVVGPQVTEERMRRAIDAWGPRFGITLDQLRNVSIGQRRKH